ncbi:MAG: acyl-CoA dehydrogenase family protein [Planctomycetota bacterium]|nr:acyl-CoA dehydrogenase family protein [Planctomycetota bacterium]MEC9048757.1 acyl-CoA dehydrogenase family protein [Planctomycetota bacterium]
MTTTTSDASVQVPDFRLTPELVEFRETIKAYCREHLADADVYDRETKFPREAVAAAAAQGLLCTTVSKEYGGTDLGNLASCIMLEEINSVCVSTGVTISVHNSLVNSLLGKWCNEEQKQRWLPKMVTGEWLGAYCLSEAFSGSDAAALRCEAKKDGDDYVMNGAKLWITTGSEADLFVVFARTGEDRIKGISAFVVEGSLPGVSVGKKERKLGLKGSPTTEIVFEDVRVPADCLLGAEGEGFKIALDTLDGGRLGIASQALGIARAAIDLITAHLSEQADHKGRPNSSQPDQWQLADLASDLEAYRFLTWRAAVMRDRGDRCGTEAAMAKSCTARLANRAARSAVSILGPKGASGASAAERLMRDARITEIYEGATDIQRLVIARGLLA